MPEVTFEDGSTLSFDPDVYEWLEDFAGRMCSPSLTVQEFCTFAWRFYHGKITGEQFIDSTIGSYYDVRRIGPGEWDYEIIKYRY